METSFLSLRLEDEEDGTYWVEADVRSGNFAGRGVATLPGEDLRRFADELVRMARDTTGESQIRGGHAEEDGGVDVRLGLRVRAADRLGHFDVRVDAADLDDQRVTALLRAEAAGLERFAGHLAEAVAGELVRKTVAHFCFE